MFIKFSLIFKVINCDTEILENRHKKKKKIIPNSILLTTATATVFISLHFLLAFPFVHFLHNPVRVRRQLCVPSWFLSARTWTWSLSASWLVTAWHAWSGCLWRLKTFWNDTVHEPLQRLLIVKKDFIFPQKGTTQLLTHLVKEEHAPKFPQERGWDEPALSPILCYELHWVLVRHRLPVATGVLSALCHRWGCWGLRHRFF